MRSLFNLSLLNSNPVKNWGSYQGTMTIIYNNNYHKTLFISKLWKFQHVPKWKTCVSPSLFCVLSSLNKVMKSLTNSPIKRRKGTWHTVLMSFTILLPLRWLKHKTRMPLIINTSTEKCCEGKCSKNKKIIFGLKCKGTLWSCQGDCLQSGEITIGTRQRSNCKFLKHFI